MLESDFIDWICRQGWFDPSAVLVGPGDDCAVVRCGSGKLLVTVDQVLDGVHFDLAAHGTEAAGRKAMARNLSDVAAMAAVPLGAVASVALPGGSLRSEAEAIYKGLRSIGGAFGCPLVGGDVAAWAGPLAVSATVFARNDGIEPVLRSGARPGDAICLTGSLGGAWQAGRDLNFTPRIAEARTLAKNYDLHAMIDISDGLAKDLSHICKASGAGAEIIAADVPIHKDVTDKPPTPADRSHLDAALADGEDYELLFTLPADQAKRLCGDNPLTVEVTRIGTITEASKLSLVCPDGTKKELTPAGWEHRT